ncbi:MAG: tetratricopeptide repeat protein [Vicinamibacterales bacterium]
MALRNGAHRLVVVGLLACTWSVPAFAQGSPPQPAASTDPYYDFLLGLRLDKLGDANGALAAFERAAAADNASSEIKAEIAAFYLRRSRRDDAERMAQAALAIDAENVEAHRVLGTLLAAQVDGTNGRGQAARAIVLAREAITHLEKVAAAPVGATDIGLQYTLGRLYLRAGDFDRATQVLARVVSQSPSSVQARLSLAQAYAAARDMNGAIETLAAIVDAEPRVAATLGQFQEQAGRLAEAADSYAKALSLAPMNRELKLRRLATLIGAGDYTAAARLAAEAQGEHPEDLRFTRLQAQALSAGGDRPAALTLLESAVRERPGDAPTMLALADVYADAGRSADAEGTLRRLIAREPDNADALNYLGYLLADEGRLLDEAVTLVRRALDLDPGNPSFLDSLGWAYFQRGDFEEAENYLRPAAEQLPGNSVIQDHYGDALSRRGRWQDAIDAWSRAIDGDGQDVDLPAIRRKIDDARSKLGR